MTFLDSNEARGGLKSGGFLHHAKFICTKPTCFCICICIGDLGLWPSFPENSHLLKGQLALACSTTPVAPLLAAPVPPLSTAAPRSCTLSAPTYYFMCPSICLTLVFCYYFCCYILVLQLHLFCTAICRMSQLYPFVENCSQALPRAQSFWWEIRVAACYWMVQEHAWCYKSTTCTILEKYFQVIQIVSTTTGSLSSKYHRW